MANNQSPDSSINTALKLLSEAGVALTAYRKMINPYSMVPSTLENKITDFLLKTPPVVTREEALKILDTLIDKTPPTKSEEDEWQEYWEKLRKKNETNNNQ